MGGMHLRWEGVGSPTAITLIVWKTPIMLNAHAAFSTNVSGWQASGVSCPPLPAWHASYHLLLPSQKYHTDKA